jgi:ligand-binding sensor domain-containing protein
LINQPPGNIKWDGRVNGTLQESDGYVWIADITGIGAVTSEHRSGQFLLLK